MYTCHGNKQSHLRIKVDKLIPCVPINRGILNISSTEVHVRFPSSHYQMSDSFPFSNAEHTQFLIKSRISVLYVIISISQADVTSLIPEACEVNI